MKHLNTVVIVLLNILLCAVTLWFFVRNSFLRPYSGSFIKETISGVVLLGSLYVNYFLLYPKLYQNNPKNYWLTLMLVAMLTGIIDVAIAYPSIMSCNAQLIEYVGAFNFFSKILFITVGRNFSFNLFPFLFRERQHFQQALKKEVEVVYQDVRKLDVVDGDNNIHLVSIDDIFYCRQQRNFTDIYMVQNKHYTRLGSMRHLEQLFGDDFIRITTTELLPYRYIKSCEGDTVIMKQMSWESEPTIFRLAAKNRQRTSENVTMGIQKYKAESSGKTVRRSPARSKGKRNPIKPSDEKVKDVLSYIEGHSNCNSKDIINATGISSSTVERCIFALKKQGFIKHTGSKRNGGYDVVSPRPKRERMESVQQEENGTTNKIVQETPDKGKPAEPSSKE